MSARVLFMVMVDVEPASIEVAFNEWYNDEHVPELLRVPGFLTGRRYRAIMGKPKYLAVYELAGIDALIHPLFLQARPAHPRSTALTKKMWAHTRNLRRGVYERLLASPTTDKDDAFARFSYLLGLHLDPRFDREFRDWAAGEHLPNVSRLPDIVRTRCFSLHPDSTDQKDEPGRYVLFYDLTNPDACRGPEWNSWQQTPAASRLLAQSTAQTRNLYERIYPV